MKSYVSPSYYVNAKGVGGATERTGKYTYFHAAEIRNTKVIPFRERRTKISVEARAGLRAVQQRRAKRYYVGRARTGENSVKQRSTLFSFPGLENSLQSQVRTFTGNVPQTGRNSPRRRGRLSLFPRNVERVFSQGEK